MKVLVIEDREKFMKRLRYTRRPMQLVRDCELKDMIKFETVVKVAVTPKGQEMYLMICLLSDKIKGLKYGDSVDVYLVKQKKEEESDDPK